jgi:hypothetical protein
MDMDGRRIKCRNCMVDGRSYLNQRFELCNDYRYELIVFVLCYFV